MSISSININRVSHNLRTTTLVRSMQQTQRALFDAQSRIASGRAFMTASENPVAAARALDLTDALARQDQFMSNLRHGDSFLAASDNAISEIAELISDALVIASLTVGSLTTPAERNAEAEVVASIRQQLQGVGNRQFMGRYIFGGRTTLDRPFVDGPNGIAYVGDTGDLFTRVTEGFASSINLSGDKLFGALSSPITQKVDLTPQLTAATQLVDLNGAVNQTIPKGTLVINEAGGAGSFRVDLTHAETMGDVVEQINDSAAEAGAGVTASLSATGLVITPSGGAVSITDTSGGAMAADLGILTRQSTSDTITGETLVPHLTRLTPIDTLAGGADIDLDAGLIITNGGRTAEIDLSTAQTVQDIINAINNAGVFVLAKINDDGTAIDVFNQVSGSSLTVGEKGGTTATDLGLRTLNTATPLAQANFGSGVGTVEGEDDLRINAKDGSTFEVNLDGAETIGEVIGKINAAAAAAGVNVAAALTGTGNGIELTDGTGGTGRLSVSPLNLSSAAADLGLAKTVDQNAVVLIGDDVNPTRTDGIIGALIDLENALRTDHTQGISAAAQRIEKLGVSVTRMHGVVGARSQGMSLKLLQMEETASTTKIFLSQIKDLDYAEAVTQLQASLTQFQGSLRTSSSLMNISLLDFLR